MGSAYGGKMDQADENSFLILKSNKGTPRAIVYALLLTDCCGRMDICCCSQNNSSLREFSSLLFMDTKNGEIKC